MSSAADGEAAIGKDDSDRRASHCHEADSNSAERDDANGRSSETAVIVSRVMVASNDSA